VNTDREPFLLLLNFSRLVDGTILERNSWDWAGN
jgi:hypothetical protein